MLDQESFNDSKGFAGQQASATEFLSAGDKAPESSPFNPPNEEQVFIAREAEKQRKKELKEAAKNLKIWDKKTATSRMPLKRVRDKDIKPTQNDENLFNYNSR